MSHASASGGSSLRGLVCAVVIAGTWCAVSGSPRLESFAELDLANVAVTAVAPGFLSSEATALLATQFSPTEEEDGIFYIPDLASLKASSGKEEATLVTLDTDAVWPNQAVEVSSGVVGGTAETDQVVLGSGGFFVSVPGFPSKSTGEVDLYFGSSGNASFAKKQVSTDKHGFFYHHAEWTDVDGDGDQDLFAARCFYPQHPNMGPATTADLVWLEQPKNGRDDSWTSHTVIVDGPEVAFTVVDLDQNGEHQILSAEYFVNQRLALYTCNASTWSGCADGLGVEVFIVDDSEGTMFDLEWVDLNADGTKDILATSQGLNGKGKVLAYEMPKDWSAPGATWTKHELASGYAPLKPWLPGQGSPGTARSFMIDGEELPRIIVSADDGGHVDILTPVLGEEGVSSWTWNYTKTVVLESSGTIGTVSTFDIDEDGTPEVFVPLYDESRLGMYTLKVE